MNRTRPLTEADVAGLWRAAEAGSRMVAASGPIIPGMHMAKGWPSIPWHRDREVRLARVAAALG